MLAEEGTNEMALFTEAAELAETLAGEASRLKKRAAIAAAILTAHRASPDGDDSGLLAMYVAGTPFAEADARRLNAGGALLSKALKAVSGTTDAALTAAYRRHGDMGAAAFDLLLGKANEEATLTLTEVAEAFAGMAVAKTTAIRSALVEELLRQATALEAKYLLKLMLGDMRIGVKQSLVEEAISVAAGVAVSEVRRAVMLEANLAEAVGRAFAGTLGETRMRLFHPLGFMLASPVETPEEAVERFTEKGSEAETPTIEAFLEDKYDGMRAQVHCGAQFDQAGRVAIYSRNKEEITESFPELQEAFSRIGAVDPTHAIRPHGLGTQNSGTQNTGGGGLILDGEILGWDFATGQALPFAVIGQRIGRKKVSGEMLRQIPVVFMAFDLLYARGELLLEKPLRERRNALEAVVEELGALATVPIAREEREASAQGLLFAEDTGFGGPEPMARLMLSPSRLVESAEEIDRAYAAARARANEGVMLKAAGSSYQPGRRGLAWVKLKRELATLDVVITGAEFGHGRRAGLLSDYTFAVRGDEGELLNVGKAYSGLTDVEIAELSAWAMAHTLDDHGHFRTVEPVRVLEVAFNNIMRSGRHASGFAMRFPRIVQIRDDKPVDEIDTLGRVEEIYQSQVDKPVE
jgi:DNA ligase-1